MIIIDYSGIAVAGFYAQTRGKQTPNEDMLRHIILNTLRMYNLQFREQYGEMVIACDGGSWRKDIYPEYKASRKKAREDSGLDWGQFFEMLTTIREEIRENVPWRVMHLDNVEADDIIATLIYETQEFGKDEPVMIVSADKDFFQLHKFNNVKQYSPMKKGLITEKDPIGYIREHVFRGDASDGVPNVLSHDKVFVNEDDRQTPLSKKKITEWINNYSNLAEVMPENVYRNFQRNQKMIDLEYIPMDIKLKIVKTYNKSTIAPNSKVLNYLVQKRCNNLVPSASEFFKP